MQLITNPTAKLVVPGVALAAAFTTIIAATAANLTAFETVGPTVPFAYPWRLAEPTAIARLTAWAGYLLHNIIAWAIIYRARREKPAYGTELRWFNKAMIVVNLAAIGLHFAQSQLYYDGLAADVHEATALGSVALMLMIVILFETPRRGLIFGKKFKFKAGFMQAARQYHGYLFSWAIIYTFWYHPTEGTWGHLMGFFYMFMLFVQSTLIFNRAHVNKYWTFTLEFFVLIHGVVVAILQGNALWPMFAFGFGSLVVLTQMYGLGLNTLSQRLLAALFVIGAVVSYAVTGRLAQMHEIIRIPLLDYMVIFFLYGSYLLVTWVAAQFQQPSSTAAAGD